MENRVPLTETEIETIMKTAQVNLLRQFFMEEIGREPSRDEMLDFFEDYQEEVNQAAQEILLRKLDELRTEETYNIMERKIEDLI